jgi:cell division protein FtsL
MTRRQWLLAILLTASAVALINARYQERRLYTQMDRIDRGIQKLESDIESLQIELTTLRNPARIDTAAKRDLKMAPIRPTETLYYVLPRNPLVAGANE